MNASGLICTPNILGIVHFKRAPTNTPLPATSSNSVTTAKAKIEYKKAAKPDDNSSATSIVDGQNQTGESSDESATNDSEDEEISEVWLSSDEEPLDQEPQEFGGQEALDQPEDENVIAAERDRLKADLEKAREDENGIVAERDRLKADLEKAREDENGIVAERDRLKADLEKAREDKNSIVVERDRLKADLAKAREDKNSIVAERDRLKTELTKANETVEISVEKSTKLGLKLKVQEDKCNEYIAEIVKLKQDSGVDTQQLKSDLDACRAELERCKVDLAKTREEKDGIAAERDRLEADLTTANAKIKELQIHPQHLLDRTHQADDSIAALDLLDRTHQADDSIAALDLLDRTHQADDSIATLDLANLTHQADDSANSAEESARRLNPEEAARNRAQIREMAAEAPVRSFAGGDPNIAAPIVMERHGVPIQPREPPSPREQFKAAAKDGDLAKLRRIYAAHPGRLQDFLDFYPDILHPAAQNNYVDVCQWLLLIGADKEFCTPNGWTPLHRAARRANHEIVSLLTASHSASINSLANGKTPLHMAIKDSGSEDRERVLETIKVLLAAPGIDLKATSSEGETPLMLARRIDPDQDRKMTKMIETRLSSN
ncbi:ankyrin repeats (3 copies) domain-containing protein [Ditylenchus destructor]|nr:ankyrin repeats (3 copies) domain-containing protein [Ditylenchus destructor]